VKRVLTGAAAAWIACAAVFGQSRDAADQAETELGVTTGVPQATGFVFIEGRYLPPPYTVTRKGNGLFINRTLVERPVPWPPAAAPQAPETEKRAAGDEAPRPRAGPQEETPQTGARKKIVSIDDLFADEDLHEETIPVAGEEAERPVAEAAAVVGGGLSAEEAAQRKTEALAVLERLRKGYEAALSQGEVFFFSQRHNRVNGTYGTARLLLGVLPAALRYAQSPSDLMARLYQGDISFIDLTMCAALYDHRNTFPLLEERLARIEEAEREEERKRKAARRR